MARCTAEPPTEAHIRGLRYPLDLRQAQLLTAGEEAVHGGVGEPVDGHLRISIGPSLYRSSFLVIFEFIGTEVEAALLVLSIHWSGAGFDR